jgi:hypothetical protein
MYKSYRRHKAGVHQIFEEELSAIGEKFPNTQFSVAVTGSAGVVLKSQLSGDYV